MPPCYFRSFSEGMKFSIVTPSYNMLEWLKPCVASVRDQEGVEVEHIVQDACSPDGTADWLVGQKHLRAYVEKDDGMYDAINRGIERSTGEILAYLNCDEQYLPGALAKVAEAFEARPEVDVIFGDFIVVDEKGEFRACRKVVCPSSYLTLVHTMPVGPCATFFRRRLVEERGLRFDSRFKAMADKVWVQEMADRRLKMHLLRSYTSTFATTGTNLAYSDASQREMAEYYQAIPKALRMTRPLAKVLFRLRKWRSGCYRQHPFSYRIYTREDVGARKEVKVSRPTFRLARFC
jgi:glycosyltransferase involved in cell wall biosynthesis